MWHMFVVSIVYCTGVDISVTLSPKERIRRSKAVAVQKKSAFCLRTTIDPINLYSIFLTPLSAHAVFE